MQKLTTASNIAAHIQQSLPSVKSGTLRFWGVWFGRPYDNIHRVVQAGSEGDCLMLHFNSEETLQIWHPIDCRINSKQFVIRSASRVLWSWYYYGRPHTPENLKSEEFFREGENIGFKTNFEALQDATPNTREPAVQIV